MELRKLDAEQGIQHVKWLSAFLPEEFSRRAGDNDAILMLLLVNRLIFKCELLATQVNLSILIFESMPKIVLNAVSPLI